MERNVLLFICWLRAMQTLPEGEKALGFENRPRALPHATVVLSNAHSIYNLAVWCKNAGTESLHDFTVNGVRVTPAMFTLKGWLYSRVRTTSAGLLAATAAKAESIDAIPSVSAPVVRPRKLRLRPVRKSDSFFEKRLV